MLSLVKNVEKDLIQHIDKGLSITEVMAADIVEKKEVIQTKMTFQWWVDMSVIMAGIGTLGLFVIELIKLFHEKV